MLSKELLEILHYPKYLSKIIYDPQKNILTCKKCKKVYQVKDDIPIMLLDDDPGTSK